MEPLLANLFVVDQPQTLWQRLDELTRGRVTLALVGLLLLAGLLMILVVISARMMRRIARHRPPERSREISDWDRKQPVLPEQNSDDAS
jgi:hypothetical protein